MEMRVIPVSDITPNTKSWAARVLVTHRLSPRESRSSSKKYQKFVFIDQEGTKIQGIVYGSDISMVENILKLQETYLIANAKVMLADPRYKMVPHRYEWIINKATVIRIVNKDALPRELGAPIFVKFADIPTLPKFDTLIDVLAIVIDRTEQKHINTKYGPSIVQEFYIINDEKIPLMLSFWNEVLFSEGQTILTATEKMPIIAATRLSISDYQGTSLVAKGSANIVVNPSYPETQYLRNWRSENCAYLTEIVEEKNYLQFSTHSTRAATGNRMSLLDITTSKMDKIYSAKVTLQITNHEQKFWYMACGEYFRLTNAECGWDFRCHHCQKETIANPRTKLAATFYDDTTHLDAMLFGESANSILGLSAVEIMNKDTKDEKLDCDTINIQLNGQEFISEIRRRTAENRRRQQGGQYQYTVISLEKIQGSLEYPSQASSSTYPNTAGSSSITAEKAGILV